MASNGSFIEIRQFIDEAKDRTSVTEEGKEKKTRTTSHQESDLLEKGLSFFSGFTFLDLHDLYFVPIINPLLSK